VPVLDLVLSPVVPLAAAPLRLALPLALPVVSRTLLLPAARRVPHLVVLRLQALVPPPVSATSLASSPAWVPSSVSLLPRCSPLLLVPSWFSKHLDRHIATIYLETLDFCPFTSRTF
jgi:hypothetical protein